MADVSRSGSGTQPITPGAIWLKLAPWLGFAWKSLLFLGVSLLLIAKGCGNGRQNSGTDAEKSVIKVVVPCPSVSGSDVVHDLSETGCLIANVATGDNVKLEIGPMGERACSASNLAGVKPVRIKISGGDINWFYTRYLCVRYNGVYTKFFGTGDKLDLIVGTWEVWGEGSLDLRMIY
ncbi:MAG: hypothetical protein HYT12_01480 [Candidatus Liptonbacteria bacterium]|nr:hypothetical protein [Candidatus Liptonbacteria bacterium]